MDLLALLRAQHAEILGLFVRIGALEAGDRWCALDILVEAIDLHLRVTPICWAWTRTGLPKREETDCLARARVQLAALDPADSQFMSELARLHEQVVRHCRREHERLFPALEQQLDRSARAVLAAEILEAIEHFERDEEGTAAGEWRAAVA